MPSRTRLTPKLAPPSVDFDAMLQQLPADWEERMHAHDLVSSHPDARLVEARQVMRILLMHAGMDLPLRQTVRWASEAGMPTVSHVSLHRKMKRVGPYLQELISRMADDRMGLRAESWGGYEVVAIDGSVVVPPGTSGAGGRLHVVLRVTDLCVVAAQITTTESGETLRRFAWSEGQLVIADRGYANPVGVAHVVEEGADILVRVNRGALPLYDDVGERIDLLAWVRRLSEGKAHHRTATVLHGDTVIHGRLVAKRLPEDKIAQAQNRARREVGDDAETLELACWVMVFTTASAKRLTDHQVIETYRVRWQIELLFKRWKSLCHIDRMPNYRPDTLVSWLSAKMVLLMMLERMAQPAPHASRSETSPPSPEEDQPPAAKTMPPAKPRTSPSVLRRQPWKLASIVWPAMMAALAPSTLSHVVDHLPQIASALDKDHRHCNPSQLNTVGELLGHRVAGPEASGA
jgi:hypothetical protein